MKNKKLKQKERKEKNKITFPLQLRREDYFKCPIWWADEPTFVDKLNQSQVKDLKQKRDSNIVWMSDRWIYKEIQPYVHQANANAGWNSQWDF